MSHHIEDLLSEWQAAPKDGWVLAVVTKVQGSAYRKAGAMMLFHPLGKTIGMVSGGCLEGDLKRHAQRAIQYDAVVKVKYDARDESDASYQLGCGGIVELMLFPLTQSNHYLQLHLLTEKLNAGDPVFYELAMTKAGTAAEKMSAAVVQVAEADYPLHDFQKAVMTYPSQKERTTQQYLIIPCRPRFHIAIFGGGLDAQPVANIAGQLGWKVTVIDERTSYARSYDFPNARVIKQSSTDLSDSVLCRFDAAIVMQHNLELDGIALKRLSQVPIDYIALLGPPHRRDKVLERIQLTEADFHGVLAAPAGLALGGELPESVALSILAQCHGVLHNASQFALEKVML